MNRMIAERYWEERTERGRAAVAIVLLVIGTGVASPGEPAASGPAASGLESTVVSLDKLQGQPVDIAPWAYAWRADRAVQEKPEAYFIPRRLERIDTVYRTALDQVGAAALKSEHYDMPDLLTPLPPKPRGRLLAGLLWSVRLADYRVELCWPAGQDSSLARRRRGSGVSHGVRLVWLVQR